MDYKNFRKQAEAEYRLAKASREVALSLEKLEKRFLRYVRLNTLYGIFLPYILYNKWRKRWWRKTLVYIVPHLSEHRVAPIKAVELLVTKNKCYGCKGLHSLGTLGIAVRTMDKIYRLTNLRKNPHFENLSKEMNESIVDTILDMGNYCVLAILLCEGHLD